jgi:hypothetical protein
VDCNHPVRIDVIKSTVWRGHAVAGVTSASKSMPALLAFVSFAPTLDPFGEGTEMRCVLQACVSYVFNGTLARRKKTVLSKLAIKLRVRHATPHLNTTRRPLAPGKTGSLGLSSIRPIRLVSWTRSTCIWGCMSCMAKLRWLRQKLLCGPRLHHCTRIVGVRPCRNEPYCGARECNHASRVSNFAQTPDAERRNSISNRYAIARRSVFNSTR